MLVWFFVCGIVNIKLWRIKLKNYQEDEEIKGKSMVYGKERCIEVLMKGNFKGFDFFILNLGMHPTAYIRIPKDHSWYQKDYGSLDLDVHGGLTFSDSDFRFNPIVVPDSWWIGWDYGHAGDYAGYAPQIEGKKWTTEEVFEEVKEAIHKIMEEK